jgi:hypothetical protein
MPTFGLYCEILTISRITYFVPYLLQPQVNLGPKKYNEMPLWAFLLLDSSTSFLCLPWTSSIMLGQLQSQLFSLKSNKIHKLVSYMKLNMSPIFIFIGGISRSYFPRVMNKN